MSELALEHAREKMRGAGVNEAAIEVFTHYYHELEAGGNGLIPEDSITPLTQVEDLDEIDFSAEDCQAAMQKTVLIKLNGGLGTSMGMDRAKSLLPVRDGLSFLDIICKQVLSARKRYQAGLPLIFMNSFRTREDTLQALEKYPDIAVKGIPLDFLQNQEPKLLASDLSPVTWDKDPDLEWCPPGHGDIYPALYSSGIIDKLLEQGYRYVMTSNSDNLGATPDPKVAAWFAQSQAPYAAEICTRTVNDLKGGHLAIRKEDQQLILRDTAQTPKEEMHFFTDRYRHPYFHTNNLWFDLEYLRDMLSAKKAVLGLPLIKNVKTVDPSDDTSPQVIQMETSMGSAISVFPGAKAIAVPRSRFLPVKTTNELALLRSDVYRLSEEYRLEIVENLSVPEIDLDKHYYRTIKDFEKHFPQGIPSLQQAEVFRVKGEWFFSGTKPVIGKVELDEAGGTF